MALVAVTALLEYQESFDAEDLQAMFSRILHDAKAQGLLNLAASENDGVAVECLSVGRICPEWRD
jgi:hypothetical protein